MHRLSPLLAVAAIAATVAGASAQSAAPPAGSDQTVPEKVAPDTDIKGKAGTLSEKLHQSGGVVRPEGNVDPTMDKVPPPAAGGMPVIPPPGSPGGAPEVSPK